MLSINFFMNCKRRMPAYAEKTFAARPVGASNTDFCCNLSSVRTKAPTNDVLPVPA